MKFLAGLIRALLWTVAVVAIVFTACIGILVVTSA